MYTIITINEKLKERWKMSRQAKQKGAVKGKFILVIAVILIIVIAIIVINKFCTLFIIIYCPLEPSRKTKPSLETNI